MSTYQVRSLTEADVIIKEHEKKTKTAYALLRSSKNFGCFNIPSSYNEECEVRFENVGVPYCGVPFYVGGLKILQCQATSLEKGSKATSRKKDGKEQVSNKAPAENASRKRKSSALSHQNKLGCTATVIMKEVVYYPEFEVTDHSKNNKLNVARQLREVLKSKSTPDIKRDRIIYVTVPSSSDHVGHTVGEIISNKRMYVKNEYYGPDNNCVTPPKKAYYPIKLAKTANNIEDSDCKGRQKVPSSLLSVVKKEDNIEMKAKEVRDVLHSLIALTYKPGSYVAYHELLGELQASKLKYTSRLEYNKKVSGNPTMSQSSFTPTQNTPRQIVAVVKPSTKQIAPKLPNTQRHIQAKRSKQQQIPSVLQVQTIEHSDQSSILPTNLRSNSLNTFSESNHLNTIANSLPTAIPVVSLPTFNIANCSSVTSLPQFPAVVVPNGLQPQAVTLTIPTASLGSIAPNLCQTISANAYAKQAIPIVSLPAIQAGSVFSPIIATPATHNHIQSSQSPQHLSSNSNSIPIHSSSNMSYSPIFTHGTLISTKNFNNGVTGYQTAHNQSILPNYKKVSSYAKISPQSIANSVPSSAPWTTSSNNVATIPSVSNVSSTIRSVNSTIVHTNQTNTMHPQILPKEPCTTTNGSTMHHNDSTTSATTMHHDTTTNQESSIFIEAMEAILNSHI